MTQKIAEKINEWREREGTVPDNPANLIQDKMRCSLTVHSIEDLKEACNLIFEQCEGIIYQCKPKLNTHLLNVTFHVGSLMKKTAFWGAERRHPSIGEVQIRLKSPDDKLGDAAHFIYELQRATLTTDVV